MPIEAPTSVLAVEQYRNHGTEPNEDDIRWLSDLSDYTGCVHTWIFGNRAADSDGAQMGMAEAAAHAGFECTWFDHDALQRLDCSRDGQRLTIDVLGFVSVHVIWAVATAEGGS